MAPKITQIKITEFSLEIENFSSNDNLNTHYSPGESSKQNFIAVQIETDAGITGEYIADNVPAQIYLGQIDIVADYLIGKNPLQRERHWSNIKRALRKYDRMGLAPLDIALWDLAGKHSNTSVHELLGTFRNELPVYASTSHGDPPHTDGLDSPQVYANLAQECLDHGISAFKIHTWDVTEGKRNIDREIDTVHRVGEKVGDQMDLMLDPACDYETFAEALQVGKACDEEDFFWYEDPLRDAGQSQSASKKLRNMIETPLLMTEMTRSLESHADFIVNNATDYVRADPRWDSGITGAMKIARISEGLGLDVEFHGCGPVQRHCMAATRNTNYYELVHVHPKCGVVEPSLYKDYEDSLDVVSEDGTVSVLEGPGLGVEGDWEMIEESRINTYTYN